jgi:exodeoxyribonuclease VII small subunit
LPPASHTPPQPADSSDFERALSELESLVERLERGDLPLEEALKTFERGVELTRHCQTSLKAAQQKVEILLKRSGQSGVEAFGVPEDDPSSAGPG